MLWQRDDMTTWDQADAAEAQSEVYYFNEKLLIQMFRETSDANKMAWIE